MIGSYDQALLHYRDLLRYTPSTNSELWAVLGHQEEVVTPQEPGAKE